MAVGIISRKNKDGEDEFLLVKSKRGFGKYTGFYYPPGGHLNNNEDERQSLIREIKEELDLVVEPIKKLAETSSDIKNQMTHWWICLVKLGQIKVNKGEIAEARYFTEKEMKKINLWPATRNFFEKFYKF